MRYWLWFRPNRITFSSRATCFSWASSSEPSGTCLLSSKSPRSDFFEFIFSFDFMDPLSGLFQFPLLCRPEGSSLSSIVAVIRSSRASPYVGRIPKIVYSTFFASCDFSLVKFKKTINHKIFLNNSMVFLIRLKMIFFILKTIT